MLSQQQALGDRRQTAPAVRRLPILFREQEDANETLTCRFVAELLEIQFADGFKDDAKRLAWLDDKLWFQREIIKGPKRDGSYPSWEAQYKAWEIDKFLVAETWYIVRLIREIKPLPLTRLHKLSNNEPLAANFIRGYALCHFPSDEIKLMSENTV